MKSYPNAEFRSGFHAPPKNSIDHLHLHYFVLPFKIEYYDKIRYGKKELTSTEEVLMKLKEKL